MSVWEYVFEIMRVCESDIINDDMMVWEYMREKQSTRIWWYESRWERNSKPKPGYVGMPEKGNFFLSSYMNSSFSFLVFEFKNISFQRVGSPVYMYIFFKS